MSLPEEPGPTSKGSVSEPESPVLTRSEDPAATTTALVRQYSSDASDQVDEVSKPRHKRGPRRKKPRLMGPSSLPPTSAEIKEPSLDIRDDKGVVRLDRHVIWHSHPPSGKKKRGKGLVTSLHCKPISAYQITTTGNGRDRGVAE